MGKPGRWSSMWVVVLACASSMHCGQIAKSLRERSAPQVLKSWDGAFQVTAPAGWRTNRELHAKADLGVAYPVRETYLVVLSESAKDFDIMDLGKHSAATRNILLKNLGAPQVGPLRHITIAGQPALQCDITGVAENLRLHYVHTTVKLGGFYHQLLAWTLASRWDTEQSTLRALVASFATANPAPN